ncbi:hypothetical protein SAMD00019534_104790, partial [Acytostelium subglobosum LB1]|uniref:hypothetical protein n=1 Tax=Acytostelium subglobosum LB1 TaxID=1410327 RepID=UPI0006451276
NILIHHTMMMLGSNIGRGIRRRLFSPSSSLFTLCFTTTTTNTMSSQQQILQQFTKYIPELNNSLHKGQCGRIAILGGSQEYTGAPFFAGISSLRIGSDICHIFAPSEGGTATAIKTLSPELIVHPLSNDDPSSIIPWLMSIHVLIVGPGLGRSEVAWSCAKEVIRTARSINIPLVLDGDAIRLVCTNLELIQGYEKVILTPNFVEYRALSDSVKELTKDTSNAIITPESMAKSLGNVVIVQKGLEDTITDGANSTIICNLEGMPRRCGGQGDVLAGAIGTFLAWTHLKSKQAAESGIDSQLSNTSLTSPLTMAALAGCSLLRQASNQAFVKNRRSTITDDIIKELPTSFEVLFPSLTPVTV